MLVDGVIVVGAALEGGVGAGAVFEGDFACDVDGVTSAFASGRLKLCSWSTLVGVGEFHCSFFDSPMKKSAAAKMSATINQKRRMTILLTTHQPDEAEYCDRIAVLDHGRVIACATPDALRAQVGGDVVRLEGDEAEALATEVQAKFTLAARVVDGAASR